MLVCEVLTVIILDQAQLAITLAQAATQGAVRALAATSGVLLFRRLLHVCNFSEFAFLCLCEAVLDIELVVR